MTPHHVATQHYWERVSAHLATSSTSAEVVFATGPRNFVTDRVRARPLEVSSLVSTCVTSKRCRNSTNSRIFRSSGATRSGGVKSVWETLSACGPSWSCRATRRSGSMPLEARKATQPRDCALFVRRLGRGPVFGSVSPRTGGKLRASSSRYERQGSGGSTGAQHASSS